AGGGDRAGRPNQARLYQGLVRQELEMEPDSEIEALAISLSRPVSRAVVASQTTAREPSDEVASVRESAETVKDPSEGSSRAHPTLTGKSGIGWERAVLYSIVVLAVLMTGAAI